MLLSIVIPVYNELQTIEEVVGRALKVDLPIDREVLVVDDGSTDGSKQIIERLPDTFDEYSVRVFFHDRNQGKGAALRTGFAQTTGDIVIIQDADLEYDPQDFTRVIGPIMQGKADAVYGSRFVGGDEHRVHLFWHMVGNKMLTIFSNMLSNVNLTDMETCYKAFKGDLIRSISIESDDFRVEPELTAKLAKRKARIYEVGISYSGRDYSEGKKITWKDGIKAVAAIVRFNCFR